MDFVLFFGKCYYKWNRQVTTLFNIRVSCTYTLSMKLNCVCGSGKNTAKKDNLKKAQARKCPHRQEAVHKNCHEGSSKDQQLEKYFYLKKHLC